MAAGPAHAPPRAAPLRMSTLASHMDIAWDLDGTLLGHPASPLLHRFIAATPRIRHVIITFRNRRRDGYPWAELARYRDGPGCEAFEGVVFVEDAAIEEFARSHRASPWRLGGLLAPSVARRCREWKGAVCSRHGLTALVDDKTAMVAAGCRRFGIELFHPDGFLGGS